MATETSCRRLLRLPPHPASGLGQYCTVGFRSGPSPRPSTHLAAAPLGKWHAARQLVGGGVDDIARHVRHRRPRDQEPAVRVRAARGSVHLQVGQQARHGARVGRLAAPYDQVHGRIGFADTQAVGALDVVVVHRVEAQVRRPVRREEPAAGLERRVQRALLACRVEGTMEVRSDAIARSGASWCASARHRTSSSASARRNLPSCSSDPCAGAAGVPAPPGPLGVAAVVRGVPRPRLSVGGWYGAVALRSRDGGKSIGSGSGPVAGCGCGEATRDSENGDMKPAPDRPVRLGCAGGRRSVAAAAAAAAAADGSSSSSSLSLRSSRPLSGRALPNSGWHTTQGLRGQTRCRGPWKPPHAYRCVPGAAKVGGVSSRASWSRTSVCPWATCCRDGTQVSHGKRLDARVRQRFGRTANAAESSSSRASWSGIGLNVSKRLATSAAPWVGSSAATRIYTRCSNDALLLGPSAHAGCQRSKPRFSVISQVRSSARCRCRTSW